MTALPDLLYTGLLLGLGGSLHCVLMCGPLAASLPGAAASKAPATANALVYHSGRVVAYGCIGLVFGLVGQTLGGFVVQRWLSLAVGGLLVGWLLLQAFAPRDPLLHKALARWNALLGRYYAVVGRGKGLWPLLGFGVLNGFLPCGLVYLAATASLQGAHLWYSLAYMALFGLGTLPALFGISLAGKRLGRLRLLAGHRPTLLLVAALSSLFLLRGLALGIPYVSPKLHGKGACCVR